MGLFDRVRRKLQGPPAAEPPSPRGLFLEELLAAVKANQLLVDAYADSDRFAIVGKSNGQERTVFLENLFAETRDMPPENRPQQILSFLRGPGELVEEPESFADARERLVPVIRAATYWNVADGTPAGRPVKRPFAPFLVEAVVLDGEHAMRFVTEDQIAQWHVTPEEVFDAASTRLSAAGQIGIETYDDGPPTIWHVASNDSYESSRILLPRWLAGFADRVSGRPIAAIPHRSMLLVAGDGEPSAIERLRASAEAEFGASTRKLSPALYTVDDAGHVIPFELDASHSMRRAVRLGHVKLAVHEYASQKDYLEEQHKRDGTDLFVATYTAHELHSGGIISHCVWGENVESLLPRTDLVAFIRSGELFFLVRWEDVQRIADSCWAPAPGFDPPLMRTIRWPDDHVLSQLRSAPCDRVVAARS